MRRERRCNVLWHFIRMRGGGAFISSCCTDVRNSFQNVLFSFFFENPNPNLNPNVRSGFQRLTLRGGKENRIELRERAWFEGRTSLVSLTLTLTLTLIEGRTLLE